MELSRSVAKFGETLPGLEQYAVKNFATALTAIPRQLAENSGSKGRIAITTLATAHEQGQKNAGVNIDSDSSNLTMDAVETEILDLLMLKHWGLKYAVNAACTILRVDQIIMAKRAGGPKAKPSGPMDADDDE